MDPVETNPPLPRVLFLFFILGMLGREPLHAIPPGRRREEGRGNLWVPRENDAFRDSRHSAWNGNIVRISSAMVPVAWGQPADGYLGKCKELYEWHALHLVSWGMRHQTAIPSFAFIVTAHQKSRCMVTTQCVIRKVPDQYHRQNIISCHVIDSSITKQRYFNYILPLTQQYHVKH